VRNQNSLVSSNTIFSSDDKSDLDQEESVSVPIPLINCPGLHKALNLLSRFADEYLADSLDSQEADIEEPEFDSISAAPRLTGVTAPYLSEFQLQWFIDRFVGKQSFLNVSKRHAKFVKKVETKSDFSSKFVVLTPHSWTTIAEFHNFIVGHEKIISFQFSLQFQ
jgi:hypothetical protein